jgi:hypothetical protein
MSRSGGPRFSDVIEVDAQGAEVAGCRLRVYQWRPADGDHRFRNGDDAQHGTHGGIGSDGEAGK